MKSFWSRQLSVCIKIILMMFLPFYFVNSKHTQTQELRVCSRYPTTHFQVFKRGCKLIKRREEQVLLCDILRDKTNGHFSDDDGRCCRHSIMSWTKLRTYTQVQKCSHPYSSDFTIVGLQTLLHQSVRNFLSFSLLQYFLKIGFLYLISCLPFLQITTFFSKSLVT